MPPPGTIGATRKRQRTENILLLPSRKRLHKIALLPILPSLPSTVIQHILDFVPLRCRSCDMILRLPSQQCLDRFHCHCLAAYSDCQRYPCVNYYPSRRFLSEFNKRFSQPESTEGEDESS